MKALIIGYGSIGERHHRILQQNLNFQDVHLVTHRKHSDAIALSLNDIKDLKDYDYFVISNETHLHEKTLRELSSIVNNKKIFCEKPLVKVPPQKNLRQNSLFVGYLLRYHPMLQKLKSMINNKNVLSIHCYCGQYLPCWRPKSDYRQSYSAQRHRGGGVILDLSHELDLIQYLGGEITSTYSISKKLSNLEIDTEDCSHIIGTNINYGTFSCTIDYISKFKKRTLCLHTESDSYELDFIQDTLLHCDILSHETKEQLLTSTDDMITNMHRDILTQGYHPCKLKEASALSNTLQDLLKNLK
jgi:CMP-N,N'-diacetyllegionaminic acid synthase